MPRSSPRIRGTQAARESRRRRRTATRERKVRNRWKRERGRVRLKRASLRGDGYLLNVRLLGRLRFYGDFARQSAKAAFAALEIENRAQQLSAVEIGPERVGDVKLGIRDLPQQEI